MFYFPFKELIKSSKLEETGTLPEEVGGLNGDNPIEHGVVIDGYFFVDEAEEVVRYVGLAKRVIVDDGVLPAKIVPA